MDLQNNPGKSTTDGGERFPLKFLLEIPKEIPRVVKWDVVHNFQRKFQKNSQKKFQRGHVFHSRMFSTLDGTLTQTITENVSTLEFLFRILLGFLSRIILHHVPCPILLCVFQSGHVFPNCLYY